MYFLETTVLHCSLPDDLAHKYKEYSTYPVSLSHDKTGRLAVEFNSGTFVNIRIDGSALYVSIYSDEYITCIAAGTLTLATLGKIITDLPEEITFAVDLGSSPNTV